MTITDMGDGTVKFDATGDIGTTWGTIGGILADQTDLQDALDLKVDIISLAAVATSGDYGDLINTPTIPDVLGDLSDVDTTGQVFKNVLYYNGTQWIPYMLAAVAYSGSYADLSNQPEIPKTLKDLIGNGVKVGDIIQWDGTTWVVQSPSWSLEKLSDVNVVGVTAGQVLTWDAATSKWIPTTPSFTQVQSDWNQTDSGQVDFIKNKPTIPDISTLVPYTGATQDVNIGVNSFIADDGSDDNSEMSPSLFGVQNAAGTKFAYLEKGGLQVTRTDIPETMTVNSTGLIFPDATVQNTAAVNADWNATSGLAEILNKPTIPPVIGDMTKAVYDTDDDGVVDFAKAVKTKVRNSTGAVLHKGHIVYLSGSTGNVPNAVYAQANNDANSAQTFGVVYEDIPNNSDGFVVMLGAIDTLDTRTTAPNPFTSDTLVDGQVIYLSPTTAGHITNVKPSAPNHLVYVGYVIRTSPTNGTIEYRIQNGYELDELHDVVATSPVNNDYLYYDSSTSLYRLRQLIAARITDSTTVGRNILTLPNPSAIRYLRINADNSISALTVAELKTDLSAVSTQSAIVSTNQTNVGTGFEDVTQLSFPVTANKTYKWRATISFTSLAAVIFSSNGPTAPLNNARYILALSATSNVVSNQATYDTGTNGAASGNGLCTADGIFRVTASGTWTIRFRCATAGLFTVRAGSILEYEEVL
jgi:hypothetical protein